MTVSSDQPESAASERVLAAGALLASLRRVRLQVEGLAAQGLSAEAAARVLSAPRVPRAEGLAEELRQAGDRLEARLRAWQEARSAAESAPVPAERAAGAGEPPARVEVASPSDLDGASASSVPLPPVARPAAPGHLALEARGGEVPLSEPEGEAGARGPGRAVHEPEAGQHSLGYGIEPEETPPEEAALVTIGGEGLVLEEIGPEPGPSPGPSGPRAEPEIYYLGGPPAAATGAVGAGGSLVDFADESGSDTVEEEEYDPWAARRAALADDEPPRAAEPARPEEPVLASAQEAGSPTLAVPPDELDTLNDFSELNSLDESTERGELPSGAAVAVVDPLAAPRPVSARLGIGPTVAPGADPTPSPARDRLVLGAEADTGSLLPVGPSLPESLSREIAAVADADEALSGAIEAVGRVTTSGGLRVGPRPKAVAPPPRRESGSGPQLTDDSPVAAVPDGELQLSTLPEVDDREWKATVDAASEAEARGDLARAIVFYGDAIDMAPDRLVAWIGRGRCHLELGDYAAAMSDFQRAEDLAPGRTEPLVEMGNLYFARKEYGRAIEFYDHALEIDANLAMARCRRGMSHYYRRNHKAAFQDLQRAYSLDPEIPNIRKYVQMAVKAMERERAGRR